MTPKRIRRERRKGWRMPAGTISVARPSKWGNPYKVAPEFVSAGVRIPAVTPELAVHLFRERWSQAIASWLSAREALEELRAKDLACWCRLCDRHRDGKPLGVQCAECDPCHADVLLELANGGDE